MVEVITEESRRHWLARDGADEIGRAIAVLRPDQRRFVRFVDCRPDAYHPLTEAIADDLGEDLYTNVDASDRPARSGLEHAGFLALRSEHQYLVPTDPTAVKLPDTGPPDGFQLLSAADADLGQLKELDETLRDDIPGSAGWRWTDDGFREETFSFGFDPATYLIAVHTATGQYAGLIRVWIKPEGPKFGMLGIRRQWRRTRLTMALGATVFRELHERGYAEVWCDIDPTNRSSTLVVHKLGARHIGTEIELVRPSL